MKASNSGRNATKKFALQIPFLLPFFNCSKRYNNDQRKYDKIKNIPWQIRMGANIQ